MQFSSGAIDFNSLVHNGNTINLSSGCPTSSTQTVTINTLPTIDAGTDLAVCYGDTLTLSASGAVTYAWDNAVTDATPFTPTATATYTVTGTDTNGCVATDSVDVTVNSISITSFSTDVTCNGSADGNATAIPPSNNIPSALISFTNWGGNEPNNAGGEDYAHIRGIDGKWNDHTSTYTLPHLMEAESDLGTLPGYIYLGTYQGHYYYKSTSGATWSVSKATAENAGGYLAVFSDIAENNFVYNLSASSEGVWIGLYQDTTDPSYSEPSGGWKWIEINGQVGAYNYSWSDGQATATATGLAAGNYSVTVTDENGCSVSMSVEITETEAMAISETHSDYTGYGAVSYTHLTLPTKA